MELMTLVLAKWHDAAKIDHVCLDDLGDRHIVEVETVGFLYSFDELELKLVNGVYDVGASAGVAHLIPTSWLVSLHPLGLTEDEIEVIPTVEEFYPEGRISDWMPHDPVPIITEVTE